MGNRVSSAIGAASTAYTANNLNQITLTSLGGNNTAITYDANGNTVAIGAKTFGYNDADLTCCTDSFRRVICRALAI